MYDFRSAALVRALLALALMVSAFAVPAFAVAQEYPNRVVRIVIPFPPGGSAEAQARIIAQALSEAWKQPVVIDNKPGAGTTIGAAYVAKQPPDGYTLYLASGSHAISQSLYRNLPYHAVTSFTAISLLATSPFVLTVHPAVKAQTVAELVALAKQKPGGLSYASSGSGAGPHLSGELFRAQAGIEVLHVPFKGTGPALAALLGAQVDYFFADVAVLPMLQAGKLRAVAVTSAKRSSFLPEVPTMVESGVGGYETTNWSAIIGPADMPKDVTSHISASIQAAARTTEVRSRYNAQGYEPVASTPEALASHLRTEVDKYARAIALSGAKVD